MRRCSATIVVVGKQFVLYTLRVCVCLYLSSMQCACVVLYCHLWPLWLYNIFPHYLINDMIFGKKKLQNIKCVFTFSLEVLSETFLILRTTATDMKKKIILVFI